jgi:hypothetical protein
VTPGRDRQSELPEKILSYPEHRWVTLKAIRHYCNGRWWPVTTEIAL